jgi:hypothetical protein
MKKSRAMMRVAVVVGAAGLTACAVEQPLPQCTVGRGAHAVRYEPQSGSGACATKVAENVGAQSFRQLETAGTPPVLALRPTSLAVTGAQDAQITSQGSFLSEYPSEDEAACAVPSLSEASQEVGGVLRRYRWSDVKLYNTAAIPGTQWTATLAYSEGDCSATFKAVGVFPSISCRVNGELVPSECNRPRPGLSLDPAFPVRCDTDSGLCVLDGEPPAVK